MCHKIGKSPTVSPPCQRGTLKRMCVCVYHVHHLTSLHRFPPQPYHRWMDEGTSPSSLISSECWSHKPNKTGLLLLLSKSWEVWRCVAWSIQLKGKSGQTWTNTAHLRQALLSCTMKPQQMVHNLTTKLALPHCLPLTSKHRETYFEETVWKCKVHVSKGICTDHTHFNRLNPAVATSFFCWHWQTCTGFSDDLWSSLLCAVVVDFIIASGL